MFGCIMFDGLKVICKQKVLGIKKTTRVNHLGGGFIWPTPRRHPQFVFTIIRRLSNPNPKSDPNTNNSPNPYSIACIFTKIKNWGCLRLPLRRSEVKNKSKLLNLISPLTYFINLVTILLLLQLLGDLWWVSFFKWPPCSQISKLSLETKQLCSPRVNFNYPLKYILPIMFLPISTLQGLKDFFLTACPSYPLNIFGQLLYVCVPISLLYA